MVDEHELRDEEREVLARLGGDAGFESRPDRIEAALAGMPTMPRSRTWRGRGVGVLAAAALIVGMVRWWSPSEEVEVDSSSSVARSKTEWLFELHRQLGRPTGSRMAVAESGRPLTTLSASEGSAPLVLIEGVVRLDEVMESR